MTLVPYTYNNVNKQFVEPLINYNHILFKEKYIHYGLDDSHWQTAIHSFMVNHKKNRVGEYYKYNIFFDDWAEEFLLHGTNVLNKKYIDAIQINKYKFISFIHSPPFLQWNVDAVINKKE